MIEIRIVEHGLGMRSEIQYRNWVLFDEYGGLCPPTPSRELWSEWKTAPWVKAEGGNADD